MKIFIILLSILAGASFIIIKSLNMKLGCEIGIYRSNFVNHLTGTVVSIIIVLLTLQNVRNTEVVLFDIPWHAFSGGIVGAVFVVLSNYSFSKTNVITSTLFILSGQFLSSILIDIFILQREISFKNIIGAIIIILSVILYNSENAIEKEKIRTNAQCCGMYRTRFLHKGENFPLTARNCWNCKNSVLGKCKATQKQI